MTLGLDSALSGLRVAQRQLDVISGNVSNASTEGYSRKILPQQTQVVGGQTIGVLGGAVIRQVDMAVQKDVWTQVSATSFYDVQAGYMSQIQNFNGPPDKELSIAATIAGLQDDFVKLANTPDDVVQLNQTVIKAQAVVKKFNAYSSLINQMRNDTQTQITDSVGQANNLLSSIADLNSRIKFTTSIGGSVAALEDQRDTAIRNLSELIGITSFRRADNVLVVQTIQGQQLADERAETLYFKPGALSAQSAYPSSAAGLYIGDPTKSATVPDITTIGIGGKIGGELDMRDNVLPRYQAQIDEMAQKMASRFDAQGVRLFTDASGTVPPDTAPSTNPIVPVPYVGFASQIQVNNAIIRDNTLLQKSTLNNVSVQAGSSEFLRRIVDYAFGEFEYQKIQGSTDIRVAGLPSTLQATFGLNPSAQVVGAVDIKGPSTGVPLNQATGNPFTPPSGPPLLDTFTLKFGADPAININLTTVEATFPTPPAVSGADALVSYINANVVPTLTPPANTQVSASLNQFGQLVLDSQIDVTVGAGNMGTDGLAFLGLTAGTTTAQSPYFDLQVGADNPVRITVDPGDTEVTLLAKLNAVPGVQASINASGFLSVRPGPGFGGDIKIIGGTILSTGSNTIVRELFGTDTPVVNVANTAIRLSNLGPNANISIGVTTTGSITDFAQKTISAQAQDANNAANKQADEQSYRDLIEKQFKDTSGVNLDEELAQLIVVQTAYAASAKTISSLSEMFDQLLNAF